MFVLKSEYEKLRRELNQERNKIDKLEKYNKDNICFLNDLIKNNYCEEIQEINDFTTLGEYKYLIGKYTLNITFKITSDIIELFDDNIKIIELYFPKERVWLIINKLNERIEELKKLETDINIIDRKKKK